MLVNRLCKVINLLFFIRMKKKSLCSLVSEAVAFWRLPYDYQICLCKAQVGKCNPFYLPLSPASHIAVL